MIITKYAEGLGLGTVLVTWDDLPRLENKLRKLAYSELTSGKFEAFGISVKVLGRWSYQVNGEDMDAAKLFEIATQLTVYKDIYGNPFCVLRGDKQKASPPSRVRKPRQKNSIFVPMNEIDGLYA